MEIIKEDQFRKQIKKGLSGAYLFFGDEDYMKSFALRSAREAICPDETFALFNEMKLDALDYSASALLDAIMPMPMMSEQKLITVNGLDINGLKQKELDELCEALESLKEYDYNVVIITVPAGLIDEGNLPKRPSSLLSRIGEFATPVLFEPVTGARLVSWVGKHFEHHGVKASPEVAAKLIAYSGRSMFTLSFETEKLSYYVLWNGRDTVTEADVLNVSIGEISTDAFTLANAILDGRNEDALTALGVMKFRRVEPLILLGEVSRVICDLISVKSLIEKGLPTSEAASILKMNEYKARLYASGAASRSMKKLRRALELCSEADLSLKLSPTGYAPIEKLVCSL